jgi:hypothetical protein
MASGFNLNMVSSSVLSVKKERNFVILVGGPGLYDGADPAHDKAWYNYIDPVMAAAKFGRLSLPDEHSLWYVYEPAYKKRWADDMTEPSLFERKVKDSRLQVTRHGHTKKVTAEGASDYIDHIKNKAATYVKQNSHRITVHTLSSGADFWSKLGTFPDQSISRVWYLGHAAHDLWLSLEHENGEAWTPAAHEKVKRSDISDNGALARKFAPDHLPSKFYGCNTEEFAQIWSSTFNLVAEGANGKVNFNKSSLGDIEASATFGWKRFAP